MTNATAVEAMVERLEPETCTAVRKPEVRMFTYLDADTKDGSRMVRCVIREDGEPWFVAKDVAEVLGYARPRDAIADHCRGGVRTALPSNGGPQEMTIIPERDVYRLIMRSQLPTAQRFEEWVVGSVLPSIRKHGAYMTPAVLEKAVLNPDFVISLCERIKTEQERVYALEAKVKQDAPKVQYHDAVQASAQEITVADLAALLKKNGVEIGRNGLFEWMRKNKFLCSRGSDRNRPSYVSQVMGILTCHNTFAADGTPRLQPLVTPKGQTYFLRCFGIITAPLTWSEDQERREIEEDRCRWWAKKRIGDTEKPMCAFEKGTLGEWEELDKILRVGTLTGKYADELVEELDF